MYTISIPLSKEYLEKKIHSIQIMEFYLGMPFVTNSKFKSPFREDKNPSCSYGLTYHGQAILYDFSTKETLNCYQVVMKKFSLNFFQALEKIADDFNIPYSGKKTISNFKPTIYSKEQINQIKEQKTQQKIIKSTHIEWDEENHKYWKDYHLPIDFLKENNVFVCKYVWVNDYLVAEYTEANPIFRYNFGNLRKFYFPFNKEIRFMGAGCLQYSTFSNTEVFVLTKSYKDVLCYKSHNIDSMATSSESMYLTPENAKRIKERYKRIYVNGDPDPTGLKFNEYHKENYGFIPLIIQEDNCKDFADLQKFSIFKAENLIHKL